ncbi:hypothetical protein I302_100274 [Kwoniella bestiolae CBS 10118]|uniref:Uncharacterized protein n=1 Tax=Kwoniella bestiolae CBS 10118 TaxID=1296100 RepID=A0A1B9G4K5_9TREE|nr:hypothetical protein I302_03646 [Kwoniella bestiolae CBS 10118]OCF25969.1 hypothetical protein I302_03646 [Kwoniella bestiolae CBS 10118]
MTPKSQDESSSERGSSEAGEELPDLNKMLSDLQRKTAAKYQKLELEAIKAAEKDSKEKKAEWLLAKDTTHKKELNDLYAQLTARLNPHNARLAELLGELQTCDEEIQAHMMDEVKRWKVDNEGCSRGGRGFEKGIEKGIKDEMKGYEILRAVIGPNRSRKSEEGVHEDE